MRVHPALAPRHLRYAPARFRRGHHGGQGVARSPARHYHPGLRQAAAAAREGASNEMDAFHIYEVREKSHQWCENEPSPLHFLAGSH